MDFLIAIDPGKGGGIAMWSKYHKSVVKMPATTQDIVEALTILGHEPEVVVYLEKVHSFPGQGVVSTWKFAENYGTLLGIITALGYKLVHVQPQKWQGYYNLKRKSKDESNTIHKNRIKQFAQERYPDIKITLATSDALAILEYAKEMEGISG